jgi:3-oxoadipate enol-lactonase
MTDWRSEWIERDGARLFALDGGSGDAIVFMHGGLADHRAALFRVGALAPSHRLIVPDLRGSGRSIDARALGWDRLADDVAGWLDHLAIDRAIVGGVSAGSAVALRFALRHPARLHGLVLMSPVYAGHTRGLTDAQLAAFRAMDDVSRRVLVEGIGALLPLYERLPPNIRALATEMARGFDPASVAASTRLFASGAQPFDDLEELRAIAAPALLIPGTDAEHPAEIAALYARHLSHPKTIDPIAPDLIDRIALFCNDC